MTDTVTLAEVRTIPASPNGHQPNPDEIGATWQPRNLIHLAANPPEPPQIGGLVYPGKRTVLSGETESMKTWFALILCKAELDIDLPVVWVDLDAMGPAALLQRLRLLQVDDDAIASRFLYIEPSEQLGPDLAAELAAIIATIGARIAVIDAFNPILNLQNLDPNSTVDVETFWRTVADPICRAGAAPVLLDHVVKNAENRGRYAYGSERKASGSHLHLGFKLIHPLAKGSTGATLISVHKDRPGYLPRPAIGRLVLTATDDHVSYDLEADRSHPEGEFRPTVLMERISKALELLDGEPVSMKWVRDNVTGNTDAKKTAIQHLIRDAYIRAEDGARGATLHTLIRPYREADDRPGRPDPSPDPDLTQNLRSQRPDPDPHPTGSGQVGADPWVTRSPDPTPYDDLFHDAPLIPLDQLADTEPESGDEP